MAAMGEGNDDDLEALFDRNPEEKSKGDSASSERDGNAHEDQDIDANKHVETVEEDGSEARRPKIPADPGRPTQREAGEHEVCHIPFRSWCPYCVKGKAVSSPHRRGDQRDEGLRATGVPTVSLDYCWADGEDNDDDNTTKEKSPILIIYADILDAMYAVSVKHKGVVPWVVQFVVKKLDTLGYGGTKITIKSDGEPAMKALVEAVAVARKAPTAIIQSPKRESKCNGAVERAVRTWRGQLVTMKCQLEAEADFELDHKEAIVEWLVMWAAEVRNYFHVHKSGRTSYELATAHRFPATTAIFAEKIMFYITPKKTGRNT